VSFLFYFSNDLVWLGKIRAGIHVLSCDEHCFGTKRRQEDANWDVHSCCCILQKLWSRAGLEICESFWSITEDQGREFHSWEIEACEGILIIYSQQESYWERDSYSNLICPIWSGYEFICIWLFANNYKTVYAWLMFREMLENILFVYWCWF